MATAHHQRFLVYAPDKTEQGTFEKRLSVRSKHLDAATDNFNGGLVRAYCFCLNNPPVQCLPDFLIPTSSSAPEWV
jgi:hypothetical protein